MSSNTSRRRIVSRVVYGAFMAVVLVFVTISTYEIIDAAFDLSGGDAPSESKRIPR